MKVAQQKVDTATLEATAIKMMDLRKQIKALELEADNCRSLIMGNVDGYYLGNACTISISDCERESLDRVSLEKALGKDFIKKHTKVSKFNKVDVVIK